MQQRFDNKVALVTGGGGGIGGATALAFASEGAKVAVVDLDGAAAERVAEAIRGQGGQAIAVQTDVSQGAEVEAMVSTVVDKLGGLDVAFNNAGIDMEHEPIALASEETFDKLMSVNVKGVWLCMKHQILHMLDHGGGAIVNTSSIGGIIGAPRQPIYGTTKHAVLGMTKAAAVEYGRKGIRVNAVCPGVIRTEMTERAVARDPRRQAHIDRAHPIGRMGEPEDIAKAVLYLCSDDASFVLGHPLMVDGGFIAR